MMAFAKVGVVPTIRALLRNGTEKKTASEEAVGVVGRVGRVGSIKDLLRITKMLHYRPKA